VKGREYWTPGARLDGRDVNGLHALGRSGREAVLPVTPREARYPLKRNSQEKAAGSGSTRHSLTPILAWSALRKLTAVTERVDCRAPHVEKPQCRANVWAFVVSAFQPASSPKLG
jgi:hypothetical protein